MSEAPGSAPAGTPAPAAVTNTPPAANNDSWTAGFTNAETKGFAELRGWAGPEQAVESFRQLEKLQGVPADRLLKLPDAEDAAGWADVHKRIGFAPPEKAEDYGLAALEGFDKDFLNVAQGIFHKHNMPKDMLVGAMKDVGDVLGRMQQDFEANRTQQHNNDVAALKTEWGANYDGLIQTGARAVAEYMPKTGLADADMDAIRDAIGSAKFNKLWAGIGSTMSEAAFHEGGQGNNGGLMTPDAARARLDEIGQDRDFFKRMEGGDAKAVNEYNRLKSILANAALKP